MHMNFIQKQRQNYLRTVTSTMVKGEIDSGIGKKSVEPKKTIEDGPHRDGCSPKRSVKSTKHYKTPLKP